MMKQTPTPIKPAKPFAELTTDDLRRLLCILRDGIRAELEECLRRRQDAQWRIDHGCAKETDKYAVDNAEWETRYRRYLDLATAAYDEAEKHRDTEFATAIAEMFDDVRRRPWRNDAKAPH